MAVKKASALKTCSAPKRQANGASSLSLLPKPLQSLAARAKLSVKIVDGRRKVVFGKGVDAETASFTKALTRSFHRAKIAALREGAR